MIAELRRPLNAAGIVLLAFVPLLSHVLLLHRAGTAWLVPSSAGLHALIYVSLLFIFGRSLRPGREAVVTRLVRLLHGRVPPEVAVYTRRVTWVWCGFFALQLAASGLLLGLAPLAWWSAFVNLMNAPLIAALIAAERTMRPLWLADPPREYLGDVWRIAHSFKQSLKETGASAL